MHYTAIKQNNRHIKVTNERREHIGSLDLESKLPGKAQITVNDNDVYSVAPSRYWDAATSITKNGLAYAEVKFNNWRQSVVLSFQNGKSFFFKRKNLWDSNYSILDEAQHEIAQIKAKFKWRTLSFSYEIDVRGKVLDRETKTAFPFILIYCTQNERRLRGAVL